VAWENKREGVADGERVSFERTNILLVRPEGGGGCFGSSRGGSPETRRIDPIGWVREER